MNQYLLNLVNQSSPANFGYVTEDQRTTEQKKLNFDLIAAMPNFQLTGNGYWKATQRAPIYDCVKKLNGGKLLKPFLQNTGSCVGQGLAKVHWYLQFVQVILQGKRDKPTMVFEPFGYANSREVGGLLGSRSAGSFGSAAATASKKFGMIDSKTPGLPSNSFTETEDVVNWSGKVDDDWGYSGSPSQFKELGKKNLVLTVAQVKTTDDLVAALNSGYPATDASNAGFSMSPGVQGTSHPVRLNRRSGIWQHQTCITDYFDHPELGLLFHYDNSWGPTAHPKPAIENDSPIGGFWITKQDMQYILDQKETFVFSDQIGFPERRIDQALLMLI